MSKYEEQIARNLIYGQFLATKDAAERGVIGAEDAVAECEALLERLESMKRTMPPERSETKVYDAPIDYLHRRITRSGMSLELAGFVWMVVLAILDWGEPLPADSKCAMKRLGISDIRRYSRLMTEARAAGMIDTLKSGEVTSSLLSAFRPSRSQRIRNVSSRRTIPQDIRAEVLAKTKGKCVYCAVQLSEDVGLPTSYHADHVLPVTRGGSDDIANLVPSCAQCNSKKSAKTALVFFSQRDGTEA